MSWQPECIASAIHWQLELQVERQLELEVASGYAESDSESTGGGEIPASRSQLVSNLPVPEPASDSPEAHWHSGWQAAPGRARRPAGATSSAPASGRLISGLKLPVDAVDSEHWQFNFKLTRNCRLQVEAQP